ncbi:hypothetical protein N1030_14615 [Desulfovibrio mangrovi]|uniref:hypothetical protein n=1 Tax=Desulfovibrio mangrovi TaxID=2976983 RepID=UPI0022470D72|nr:hypothetical protein [Desulfovibrio mangrovi]UZP66830.1 hypothetical protein N1030_14615 [Desulfovibrio mangrovi]
MNSSIVTEKNREEFRYMLSVLGSEAEVWKSLQAQFAVLHQRTQAVFGIGALAVSVTGFSGHRIVAAGPWSGYPLIIGLVFVLLSLAVALSGVVRLHWISELRGETTAEGLALVIAMRNRKTRFFLLSLKIVLFGLVWYVFAVAVYLMRASLGQIPII